MDKPVVLYIEDNADNQRLVQRVLEARGFAVQLAGDGTSGVALARESGPAIVLVDINIPGLDGYEVTTRLRSMPHLHGTPVIAITADIHPTTRDRSLVAGCDGYITKPIDPRRLPEQLQEFIGGRREAGPQGAAEASILREHNQRLVERLERQVRELSAANAELQEMDRMKSQFLATLSHELRTPLTSVLGYLELFEHRTLGPLNDVQAHAIGVIARNSRTLTRILNNLLYLQEIRTVPPRRTALQLNEIARSLVGEYQAVAAEAGVTLRAALQPAAPYTGDQTGITQSFRALIDNAVKFAPRGGSVEVTLTDEPTRAILRVVDSGIGIPDEAQEKIFLPFYQVDDSLARPYPGAGLGLAIVRNVAEAHGGQITVRSRLGHGSTFTLVLPRS